MHRPRVLVVDDSVVVRRLVSKALEAEGEVEVVGVAADGAIALVNIERLHPDVVILDVAMPVMDGLAALAEIRQRWPGLPVIMFSTLTTRGAEVTLDALALGASDYVLKPSSTDAGSAMAEIRDAAAPADRRAPSPGAGGAGADDAGRRTAAAPVGHGAPAGGTARADRRDRDRGVDRRADRAGRADPVAAGRSAGADRDRAAHAADVHPDLGRAAGPQERAARWPRPPTATGCAPGHVAIAPGDRHLSLAERDRDHLHVYDGPPENSCRPSVDPLFRSVAAGLRAARARDRDDRDGQRRAARGRAPRGRRRAPDRAGRGDERRVGHAGVRRAGRAGRRGAAAGVDCAARSCAGSRSGATGRSRRPRRERHRPRRDAPPQPTSSTSAS